MRNFVILSASAIALALGVAQASAYQYHVTAAQPAYTGELRDFQTAPQSPYEPMFNQNERSSGHH